MYVISVINYKGGVGKTTITANLGAELARRGKQVLLIDIDPQASLTFSFVRPEEWALTYAESKTLKDWFQSYEEEQRPVSLKELIITPPKFEKEMKNLGYKGRLDLVSSHLELINIDLDLAVKLGGVSLKDSMKSFLRIHSLLAKGIRQIKKEGYEFVLIDCPPNFNIVTKTAIVASDHLLIPAKPDYLSTIGIDYLIKSYKKLIGDYNEYVNFGESSYSTISPFILGVVFNMIQVYGGKPIAVLREYMAKRLRISGSEKQKIGMPVFESYFRENENIFSHAPADGLPVVIRKCDSQAIVKEIENFVNEFENRLEVIENTIGYRIASQTIQNYGEDGK